MSRGDLNKHFKQFCILLWLSTFPSQTTLAGLFSHHTSATPSLSPNLQSLYRHSSTQVRQYKSHTPSSDPRNAIASQKPCAVTFPSFRCPHNESGNARKCLQVIKKSYERIDSLRGKYGRQNAELSGCRQKVQETVSHANGKVSLSEIWWSMYCDFVNPLSWFVPPQRSLVKV